MGFPVNFPLNQSIDSWITSPFLDDELLIFGGTQFHKESHSFDIDLSTQFHHVYPLVMTNIAIENGHV